MALGFLTVQQIIQQGTQLGGNPSLANIPSGYSEALAHTFLKQWLHHVYMTRDMSFMLKEATITTSSNGPSDPTLPSYAIDLSGLTRYRAIKYLKLDTVQNALQQQQAYELTWAKIRADLDASSTAPPTGIPTIFSIKPDKSQAYVWAIPNKVYTGRILYYQIPDVTTLALGSTPDFEDSLAMVNAVAYFTRNYDKDTMVALSAAAANELLGEYRAAQDDSGRNRPLEVKLDPFRWSFMPGD